MKKVIKEKLEIDSRFIIPFISILHNKTSKNMLKPT